MNETRRQNKPRCPIHRRQARTFPSPRLVPTYQSPTPSPDPSPSPQPPPGTPDTDRTRRSAARSSSDASRPVFEEPRLN